MKESLFNIIAEHIYSADVLDVFAGTGSLGIEALSRGARTATFVDNSSASINIIKQNLEHTKLNAMSTIIYGDAHKVINRLSKEGKKFDIIFLDPPYSKKNVKETLQIVSDSGIIKNNGIVIVEKDKVDIIPKEIGVLKIFKEAGHGNTILSFYKHNL